LKHVRITFKSGNCSSGTHKVGDVVVVKNTTPEGLCLGVWNAITPYLTALRYGANFPWEREEGVITVGCPDPDGIAVELRRIETDEE
jgi:uncharacterized repeat protein (TIGR04076 family)